MAKITILIEGGQVQSVEGIPVDMYVEVRNYDVKDSTDQALPKDERGKPCHIREWRAPE